MRASSPFCKDGKPSDFDLQIGKLGLLAALSGTRLTETLLELVHPSGSVDETLLPREEGVASGADTNVQVLNRGSGLDHIAASALNRCFAVFGVDIRFHSRRKI